jgi:hypothetical protein
MTNKGDKTDKAPNRKRRTGPDLFPAGGPDALGFLREAITAVPAVKYALGVGGIAAVISIVAGWLDLRIAIVGLPVLFILMFVLLVFSRLAASSTAPMVSAAVVLVWFSVVMMVLVTAGFAITFFMQPEALHRWHFKGFYELFDITPSSTIQKMSAEKYIDEFDTAVGGVLSPEKIAGAVERIELFWRQPEQREFLTKIRCGKLPITDLFPKSAEYVFDNRDTLMKDVDTLGHFYDTVARCVESKHCEQPLTCNYFYEPMNDFKLQYTDYFDKIHLTEGRDPMEHVRSFLFSCPQSKSQAPGQKSPAC